MLNDKSVKLKYITTLQSGFESRQLLLYLLLVNMSPEKLTATALERFNFLPCDYNNYEQG